MASVVDDGLSLISNNSTTGQSQMINASVSGNVYHIPINVSLGNSGGRSEKSIEERCYQALHRTSPLVHHEYGTLIATHGSLVKGTCQWIHKHDAFIRWQSREHQLLWIRGDPGKGKSYLSIYLTDLARQDWCHCEPLASTPSPLLLTFFCSYLRQERSVGVFIIRSLIAQLLKADQASYFALVVRTFREYDTRGEDLFDDENEEPLWRLFIAMLGHIKRRLILILDGVDECDEATIQSLRRNLDRLYFQTDKSRQWDVGTIIASRRLRQSLQSFALVDLDGPIESREHDFKIFAINAIKPLQLKAENEAKLVEVLVSRAEGTYLWLALAVSTIEHDPSRLYDVLNEDGSIDFWLPQGLDPIYERILANIPEHSWREVHRILRSVCLAFQSLTGTEIAVLTDLDEGKVNVWLGQCVNLLRRDDDGTYQLIHLSLREHLLKLRYSRLWRHDSVQSVSLRLVNLTLALASIVRNLGKAILFAVVVFSCWAIAQYYSLQQLALVLVALTSVVYILNGRLDWLSALRRTRRAATRLLDKTLIALHQQRNFIKSLRFFIDVHKGHELMLRRTIQMMQTHMKSASYDALPPWPLSDIWRQKHADRFVPTGIQYACRFWARHLSKSKQALLHGDIVHQFLLTFVLSWVQVFGIFMSVLSIHQRLDDIESCIEPKNTDLLEFISDARKFVLEHQVIIDRAPKQVFLSALLQTPDSSQIRRSFQSAIPPWLTAFPSPDQSLSSKSWSINDTMPLVFSPDGRRLVTFSNGKTSRTTGCLRLWRVSSARLTLEETIPIGHSPDDVVFSMDGRSLTAVHSERLVSRWRLASRRSDLRFHQEFQVELKVPDDDIRSSEYIKSKLSVDGELVALSRRNVYLYRLSQLALEPFAATGKREARPLENKTLLFSSNGKMLGILFGDGSVWIWRIHAHQLNLAHKIHYNQEAETNVCIAFSPDDQILARAWHNKVELWTLGTGTIAPRISRVVFTSQCQELTLESCSIISIAFGIYRSAAILAVSLANGSIELWKHDAQTTTLIALVKDLSTAKPYRVLLSPDGRWLTSERMFRAGYDTTIWSLPSCIEAFQKQELNESSNSSINVSQLDYCVTPHLTRLLAFVNAMPSSKSKLRIWRSEDAVSSLEIWKEIDLDAAVSNLKVVSGMFQQQERVLVGWVREDCIEIWSIDCDARALFGKVQLSQKSHSHDACFTMVAGSGAELFLAVNYTKLQSGDEEETHAIELWCLTDGGLDSLYTISDHPLQESHLDLFAHPDGSFKVVCGSGKSLYIYSFLRNEQSPSFYHMVTDEDISFLKFASDGTAVHTQAETICVPNAIMIESHDLTIRIWRNWLYLGSLRLIWLPPGSTPKDNKYYSTSGSIFFLTESNSFHHWSFDIDMICRDIQHKDLAPVCRRWRTEINWSGDNVLPCSDCRGRKCLAKCLALSKDWFI